MRLKGKRAVVTGGGSGIGAAIARAFVREGAAVVVADFDADAGKATVDSLVSEGGKAYSVQGDVSDSASVKAMVEEAVRRLGGLDTLVNNAGFGRAGKLLDTTEEDWSRIIAVNLTGIFLCSKYALPHLLQSGSGCIVNMGSVAGIVGVKDRLAYCASKGGVISLTRAIALDYVDKGLRCNSISPGTVDTPWVGRMISQYHDPQATRAAMVARQPMGRMGRPEEIADAAVYLASPEAGFVTGSNLVIDGGMTMQ